MSLSDSAEAFSPAERVAATAGLDVLVVIDHRAARIYAIDDPDIARHVVRELAADIPRLTDPQRLDLARHALHSEILS